MTRSLRRRRFDTKRWDGIISTYSIEINRRNKRGEREKEKVRERWRVKWTKKSEGMSKRFFKVPSSVTS